MPTATTNYGLLLPLINNATDQDLWGNFLNTDINSIDSLFLGAINVPVSSKTTTYTVVAPSSGTTTLGDARKLFLCDATSAAFTINLPAASTAANMTVAIKRVNSGANNVAIRASGAELIDSANTLVLTVQYQWAVLVCDGLKWHVVSQFFPASVNLAMTVQRFTSGSGTYTTASGALYIRVAMVAGGGGGGGVGSGAGNAGGTTSFGSWTALGGGGGLGTGNWTGGAGGSGGTSGAGTLIRRQSGVQGASGNGQLYAASGGNSPFGGAGTGTVLAGSTNGISAASNSGSGGAGCGSGTAAAGAGGAGEYVEFIVASPSATYSYACGAAGAGGSGTSLGGTGGSGMIIVQEYYQ